jgi:hypothetical protein
MKKRGDYLGSDKALRQAMNEAPQYAEKLGTAVQLARSRAARSHAKLRALLNGGTVIGLAPDLRMRCSYFALERGILKRGGVTAFMWHYMDLASVNDIAKLLFAALKQRVAEDGRHDD